MNRISILFVGALALTGCLGEGVTEVVDPAPPVNYASVQVGDLHVCGLAGDGTALCWGDNITGQLGTSDAETRLNPTFIQTSLKFDSLYLGALHTCGLVAGKVYCWGANNVGQLGIGNEGFPVATPDSLTGGLRLQAFSAGSIHNCATSTDSLTYCWGSAERGQLGEGTTGNLQFWAFPRLVTSDSVFVQVTAGASHSCGLTEAGQAWCWGDATFGQIGTGQFLGSTVPTLVADGHVFQRIEAGGDHTCGVTVTGEGYCWGFGSNAQLGYGGTNSQASPTLIAGGHTFDFISAGGGHTCGLTPTDELWCWGINESGQLGDGTTDIALTPVRVGGPTNTYRSVSVGRGSLGSITCAIGTDGNVYCWGRGTEGQLGIGERVERVLVPTLVNGSI